MPRRFRRRSRRRRKTFRKRRSRMRRGGRFRRRRRTNSSTMVIHRQIVPKMLIVTLPYVHRATFGFNVGSSIANNTFRANSCFDPEFTGTGHQPHGFDQWSAMFKTYTVLSSRLSVTMNQLSDNSLHTVTAGVRLLREDDRTDYEALGIINRTEDPGTAYKQFGQTGSSRIVTIRNTYKAKAFWRRKTLTDDNQEADTNANPLDEALWVTWIHRSSLGNVYTLHFTYKMWYTVAFRHPISLSGS